MGFYDGYLILSDIDGTLTCDKNGTASYSNDYISPENMDALHRFMDNGGYFTLATGRKPEFLPDFPIQPNAPLISINGTLIRTEAGERLLHLPMTDNYGEAVITLLDAHPAVHGVIRSEECEAIHWDRASDGNDLTKLSCGTGAPCLRFFFMCEDEPAALALMADAIARYGDRYEYNRSWPNGMEMHVKGSGKDAGLRCLRDWLPGITTTIAVGNYENDLPMIREADLGCAVGDAPEHIRAEASHVIVPHTEHALAYIINELIPAHKNGK